VLAEDASCAYQPAGGREPILPAPEASYGGAAKPTLAWTPEARARIERIPSSVRDVVAKRVEDSAHRVGPAEVTPQLLDRIRQEMPVDFSKRLPFFARSGD
jgi:hypothetical protein